MLSIDFQLTDALASYQPLRLRIREFLEKDPALLRPRADAWGRHDREFSLRLGRAGFIGMTWPTEYGGGGRSVLERYVVTEEICAAGAPGGAHWGGDRQIGALLLKHGTKQQCTRYLPPMARGEISFCLGMSEPDSGSDLASIRTRAVRDGDSWVINGRKIWTTNAHVAQFVLILCRTSEPTGNRHEGLSQIVVPLDSTGIHITPVNNMGGEHEFNELLFEGVRVPLDHLVGEAGNGWRQVGGELALERSGPERFLSSFVLLRALIDRWGTEASESQILASGRLAAQLSVLRGMSIAVAAGMEQGRSFAVEAALVKDLGTLFEQSIVELALEALEDEADPTSDQAIIALVADAALRLPSFSLRGGTREILRGIVARGLGLR